ncbi:MAG: glycoside hydrolase family 88 protein [Bacteroidales bacterium]|nr:glycoside hydrolase family 88 protein [Bacteroidales bacterium]
MKRRNFIIKSSLIGGALAIPIHPTKATQSQSDRTDSDTEIIVKVKKAMLSMQRASWEQGVALQAFLELGDTEMVYLMAKEAVLRQQEDGRLSVLYTDNGVTDPAASGEAVLKAAEWFNDPKLKTSADKMVEYLIESAPRSADGIIYHTLNSPEFWVDSLYMAPPFLSVAGYHHEALKQIRGIRKILWNEEYQLFSHRWHDEENKFVNKDFWGVGNGWAAAGMLRVAHAFPEEMNEERDELVLFIKQVLDGCLKYIRHDYLFHNVIDKPDTFVETNLSQMLAYTIFRGINYGYLEYKYFEVAEKMRKAAHVKVDKHGYVQDVCGAPFFIKPGRATEGQAFFLLMEAAYKDMKHQL